MPLICQVQFLYQLGHQKVPISLAPYTVIFDKLQFYTIHLNFIGSLHRRTIRN